MIAFSCPHCGTQLQVKESRAGKTGPCPGCSRAVQVPASDSSTSSGQRSAARASHQQTLSLSSPAGDTASTPSEATSPRDYPFLAPPQGPDELGRLGPYLIRKVLGTGAMGIVFQAQDVQLKRLVALKVMKPSLAAYADYHRRFLREAQLIAAIDHEHIVTIYHVGEDRGVPFLAMKLLQGESLEDRLARPGSRLPLPEVLRIGREVAEALAAAHARGLVHRDIKPANIWLEAEGDRVKIVDFGLARGSGADAHFTQAGAIVGTPSYMAPEQANAKKVDGRCDLFSLGAVLYRACTGRLPFDGKDTLSVLAALATKTPPPPRKIDPRLPPALSDLVMCLLAKDREKRPSSARAVIEAIESIESGDTGEAEAEPAPPPSQGAGSREQGTEKNSRTKSVGARSVSEGSSTLANASGSDANGLSGNAKKPQFPARGERKRPKKESTHDARRKKRRARERNWGRLVLVSALVLLGVAALVLVLGILRHTRKDRTAAWEDRPSILAISAELRRTADSSFDGRTAANYACAELHDSTGRPVVTVLAGVVHVQSVVEGQRLGCNFIRELGDKDLRGML
jgi:serine/threonine protein kinase